MRQRLDLALNFGAPGEIRTPDPQVRSLVLYPAELRARGNGPRVPLNRAHFLLAPKTQIVGPLALLAEREGFEPSMEL